MFNYNDTAVIQSFIRALVETRGELSFRNNTFYIEVIELTCKPEAYQKEVRNYRHGDDELMGRLRVLSGHIHAITVEAREIHPQTLKHPDIQRDLVRGIHIDGHPLYGADIYLYIQTKKDTPADYLHLRIKSLASKYLPRVIDNPTKGALTNLLHNIIIDTIISEHILEAEELIASNDKTEARMNS